MEAFPIPALPSPFLTILRRFWYDLLPSYYRCPFVSYVIQLIENPVKDCLFVGDIAAFRPSHPFSLRIGVLSSLVTPAVFIAPLLIGLQLTRASCFPFQSSVPRTFV